MTDTETVAHRGPSPRPQLSVRAVGYTLCGLLLVATVGLRFAGVPQTVVFVVAGLALVVWSWLLGIATEELGASLGPSIGGVLNLTFANAPELIISFLALRAGLVDVVKASITGSILGNLLFVFGASLLVGGVKHGTQHFSRHVAGLNSTMLFIAVIALSVPAVFGNSIGQAHGSVVRSLSDAVAIVLILLYGLSMVYFLRNPAEGAGVVIAEGHPSWGVGRGVVVLLGAAVALAVLSETLIIAFEPTLKTWGVTETFAGLILVPLLGNVAEHLVSVQLAWRNKMDLACSCRLAPACRSRCSLHRCWCCSVTSPVHQWTWWSPS